MSKKKTKKLYGINVSPKPDPNNEMDTMRYILNKLVQELGEKEGTKTFEWYCKTYNVGISDFIPLTVLHEVLGIDLYPSQYLQEKSERNRYVIVDNLTKSQESILEEVKKDARNNNWEVDLKRLIKHYKDAVKSNDFDRMWYILEYLTECNFHTIRRYMEELDWKGLEWQLNREEPWRLEMQKKFKNTNNMKITKDNLASEFENYKKFLKDDDMRSKVKDTIEISEFYDDDADIKKTVDEMVEMVNEQIAKNEKKEEKPKKKEPKKEVKVNEQEPKKEPVKEPKVKEPKPKKEKKAKLSSARNIKTYDALYRSVTDPEKITERVLRDVEKAGWGVDNLKKFVERYRLAVDSDDPDEMFYIYCFLEECNYHSENELLLAQDWVAINKLIKGESSSAKAEKEPKAKEEKPKKEPKKKEEKPISNATPVEALSPEVKLIKRVITLQGKTMKKANSEKTNNPRAILNAIQRAIRTKQIRKTSKYADEIMYAQDALIRMVNGSLNGTLSGADVINFTRYDDLANVAHAEVVSESAKIAAQFIKIQEQAGKEKEAGTLLKRIEKSNEKGEEIDGMKKALKNYVDGKTTKLKASEQVLRGLHGIVDVNFESGDVVNSTTIEGKNFDTLDFHGRWEGFFGKPSPDFKFMFYGKPGNGKSTFALQFAGYLSKELGKSVLYVANEEGFGYTLQEKVKRLNVANSNLYLCDSVPEDLSRFDVVFLDSVNNLGLEPEDLKAMPSGKAYVYIFQTTKDGNYMGKQEFAHDVDTVVRVENMNAYKDKNRYGGEIQEFKVG